LKGEEEAKVPTFDAPTAFVQFGDLTTAPEDQQLLEEKAAAWPYVYLLSSVVAPLMFNRKQKSFVVVEAIKTLSGLISEPGTSQGDHQVITDVLAGVATSMGSLVALASLIDCNAFKYENRAFPEEVQTFASTLAKYLSSRGVDRETFWANKPIVVEREPEPEPPKNAKAAKGGKKGKKGKEPEPEPEPVEPEPEPEPQFGIPDPNEGPTKESWMSLLNVSVLDAINDIEDASALHTSIVTSNTELTRALLDSGATPNCTTTTALTPLMLAVAQNDKDVATMLIDADANLDAIGPEGANALKFSFCVPSNNSLLSSITDILKVSVGRAKGERRESEAMMTARDWTGMEDFACSFTLYTHPSSYHPAHLARRSLRFLLRRRSRTRNPRSSSWGPQPLEREPSVSQSQRRTGWFTCPLETC